MPRPLDHERRAELLRGVVDYIAVHGLADLSLRPLAAELGTSSRMLVHYFGTKDEMLVQALALHRPDVSALFDGVFDASGVRRRLLEFSRSNADGADTTSVRVMLQVLGAACAPDGPYARYATDAIAVFVGALADGLGRTTDVADPDAVATLLISGLRGVIQDRLITGDIERTERAAALLVDQVLR